MLSCNTAFMKAGSMGLSILFASGDQGVCGREGCGFLKHKFHPDFPAASPYITAVGGTDFETKGVIGAETAWTAGGGGFSDDEGSDDDEREYTAEEMARVRHILVNKSRAAALDKAQDVVSCGQADGGDNACFEDDDVGMVCGWDGTPQEAYCTPRADGKKVCARWSAGGKCPEGKQRTNERYSSSINEIES